MVNAIVVVVVKQSFVAVKELITQVAVKESVVVMVHEGGHRGGGGA